MSAIDQETRSDKTSEGRVWVITGTSSGLGRSLVQVALARGDRVIATARNIEGLHDFINDSNNPGRVHIIRLDVTAPFAELRSLAGEAVAKWGRVDVLINNAGSALLGITEEVGVEGYRKQFETNVFGQLNVTNAFLPYMRARRDGTIVFISSRSAWRTNIPLVGPYASSKAALSAVAEALAVEVAPLNIKVLNVLPGGLRTRGWTDFVYLPTTPDALLPPTISGAGDVQTDAVPPTTSSGSRKDLRERSLHLADYAELRTKAIAWAHSASPHINGDTEKCARAIIDVVSGDVSSTPNGKEGEKKDWPDLNMLVLGADAETNIKDKCQATLRNLDEWRNVIRGIALDG